MADSDVVDLDLTIDDLVPKSPERYVVLVCLDWRLPKMHLDKNIARLTLRSILDPGLRNKLISVVR